MSLIKILELEFWDVVYWFELIIANSTLKAIVSDEKTIFDGETIILVDK